MRFGRKGMCDDYNMQAVPFKKRWRTIWHFLFVLHAEYTLVVIMRYVIIRTEIPLN